MKHFFQTLNGKIFLVILLIAVPAMGLIYLNGINAQRSYRQSQIEDGLREVQLYATSMNTSFEQLEMLMAAMPITNDSFDRLLQFSMEDKTSQEYWLAVANVRQALESIQSINRCVENVFVYYPHQNLFLNYRQNLEMNNILLKLIETGKGQDLRTWKVVNTDQGYYLYRLYWYSTYGMGVWLSCDTLLTSFAGNSENMLLFDDQGNVLTQGLIFTEQLLDSYEETKTLLVNGEIYTVVSDQALHPGIYVAKAMTEDELTEEGIISANMLPTLGIIVLLIGAVIFGISRWVLRPVKSMVTGIERIGGGDIGYRLKSGKGTSAEFVHIGEKFNSMMDQVAQMKIQIYEQELSQKETKLRYLSQQIQPHFILNSLNTLYTYSGRDMEAEKKIIRLLSEYYRYVVNVESRYVRLGQELEHIEKYLGLQKIRYPRTMDYRIQCEDSLRIVPIPPFLLESFVGNSIKYGLDGETLVWILIDVEQIRPFVIRITVSDTGEGFAPEILKALDQYKKTGYDRDLGVGIKNSIERLKLIYHEKAEINFYNRQPHGAVTEIIIHLQQEGEEDDGNRSIDH